MTTAPNSAILDPVTNPVLTVAPQSKEDTTMKDGECYKFIIYNKSGFEKAYKQYSNHQE